MAQRKDAIKIHSSPSDDMSLAHYRTNKTHALQERRPQWKGQHHVLQNKINQALILRQEAPTQEEIYTKEIFWFLGPQSPSGPYLGALTLLVGPIRKRDSTPGSQNDRFWSIFRIRKKTNQSLLLRPRGPDVRRNLHKGNLLNIRAHILLVGPTLGPSLS